MNKSIKHIRRTSVLVVLLLLSLLFCGCDSEKEDLGSDRVPVGTLLREEYFQYIEYDNDLTFDKICENMEQLGYTTEQVKHEYIDAEFPAEKMYRIVNKNSLDEEQRFFEEIIYVVVCDDTKIAKDLFLESMNFSAISTAHRFSMNPFFQTNSIVRLNHVVYFINNKEEHLVTDFYASTGLKLPEITPLYQGGIVEKVNGFDFDTVKSGATTVGYTFYDAPDYGEIFRSCTALVSPERDCYLYLVQMHDLKTQSADVSRFGKEIFDPSYEQLAEIYLKNLFARADNACNNSVKVVMISEDAFIVGTCYHVDRLLERCSKQDAS